MTSGFKIEPAALNAHASGSKEAAGHFGSLAQLLQQARVSDDCFGPLGELMAYKYFDSLQECQDLADQAKTFLDAIADKTTLAAQAYQDHEDATTDAVTGLGKELADGGSGAGSLSDVNHAGDAGRKSYLEQNGGYGSSWLSTSTEVSQASSPPDVAIAAVHTRMEQIQLVTSPGQSLLDNGLGFLIGIVISPLVEFVLEPAIGDPEQMRSTAQGWAQVAQWLDGVGAHEQKRADLTKEPWEGSGGDAFRKQMGEFSEGAGAFADEVRGLQQILELAADLFDAFVEIVIDILQELVMGLIIEWLAALAASWITAGASVGAAGAATTGEVAVTGGRLGMKVKQLLGKLRPLIEELEKILQKLRTGPLKKVVERMEGLRGGNFLEKRVADMIDKNPLAKILTKADSATGMSRTTNHFANVRRMLDDDGNVIGDALTEGSDALTHNLTETGLRLAGMSGTSSVGKAAWRGAKGNIVEQGIEQGVKYGYHQSQTDSEEDRREATDRGFSLEE
ncbi:WXG100 family type VII secretion target [Amycolatopsis carbonis]|uniref:WXG100 family type VII secretion target n=1 Tax=Amycolatopsis carbonis TaxID=715471 RepID=A0A9Y2IJU1_9PSEU|nr:WXG100 family type VII secretion target [Amycolatopsis sp. 2-15]WIX80490.1 WXG100 family type VII secretion target [Amycolatopsis sp. 2-15]